MTNSLSDRQEAFPRALRTLMDAADVGPFRVLSALIDRYGSHAICEWVEQLADEAVVEPSYDEED